MNALQEVKSHLKPGHVYRRSDLTLWSKAVDRHLSLLQKEKTLVKLSGGLYYCPKKTVFGDLPPIDKDLVRAFLKDDRFLLVSPNMYNSLGVGTTQLYNETFVYNHKRHGSFTLGGRHFRFVMKHHFPKEVTQEFLLVDLANNLNLLSENQKETAKRLKKRFSAMDTIRTQKTLRRFGGVKANNLLKKEV